MIKLHFEQGGNKEIGGTYGLCIIMHYGSLA